MVVHNFGAGKKFLDNLGFTRGPGILPKESIERAKAALDNFADTHMSILEVSHRSPQFEQIVNSTIDSVKSLLELPSNYSVLLFQVPGGASTQFAAIPMNLIPSFEDASSVDYMVTGTWSKKATQEAQKFLGSKVNIVSSDLTTFKWSTKPSYFYYCENETVDGVELTDFPLNSFKSPYTYKDVPVVCDMSSNFLSRPLHNIDQYAMIIAGAQKNVGPAGLTIVIIRDDLLEAHRMKAHKHPLPTMFDYLVMKNANSLYNTPPVFSIFVSCCVLDWIRTNGGLTWVGTRNLKKSNLLYEEIDNSNGFYVCNVPKQFRSRMNVVFRISLNGEYKADLEHIFAKEAETQGLMQLSGHRSVGGLRASLYNALELSSVEQLLKFMKVFKEKILLST